MRTPSQTVGPFYAIGLCRRPQSALDPEGVELTGTLYDGQGEPVPDGVVEVYDPATRTWGRCGTEADGAFRFLVPPRGRLWAYVFARGLLRHQLTAFEAGGGRQDVHLQGERETTFFAV